MTIEELEELETVSRERDKFQAVAELGEGYRRERDVACDDLAFILAEYANERNEELTEDALYFKIAGLTHQRDDARTQLAMVEAWHKQMCLSSERGWAQEAERTRERDEARAALADATTEWKARRCECGADDFCKIAQERNEARAEVERLTDERDELLVRVADQGAELRATREAYIDAKWTNAYRRGAEAMREACATMVLASMSWQARPDEHTADEIAENIRALPIPGEP